MGAKFETPDPRLRTQPQLSPMIFRECLLPSCLLPSGQLQAHARWAYCSNTSNSASLFLVQEGFVGIQTRIRVETSMVHEGN